MTDSVETMVHGVDAACKDICTGTSYRIHPPRSSACPGCPWRLDNHQTPPLHLAHHTPAEYYTSQGRELMWSNWECATGQGLADGRRAACHMSESFEEQRWCAAGDGILHRELLRWWRAGRSAHDFGPLRSADAIRQVLASVIGVFVRHRDDGAPVTDGLTLEADGEQLVPCLNGQPVPLEMVSLLAHPDVLNPCVGADEAVARLSPDERAELEALHVGQDWHRAGRYWTTVVSAPSES